MVSYFEMAKAAIAALKERGGSSSQAIKKVGPSVSSRASAGPSIPNRCAAAEALEPTIKPMIESAKRYFGCRCFA